MQLNAQITEREECKEPGDAILDSAETTASARPTNEERTVPDGRFPENGSSFRSILFPAGTVTDDAESAHQPEFFVDLNLDQAVEAIIGGKTDYNLKPFFHVAPLDRATISYRQHVMRDVEGPEARTAITQFSKSMREVRKLVGVSEKLHYGDQKDTLLLEAIDFYCQAIHNFSMALASATIVSEGCRGFASFLNGYLRSERFLAIEKGAGQRKVDLASIDYCFVIQGSSVTVRKCQSETDYSIDVARTFERFRQGAVKTYEFKFPNDLEMDHIEEAILSRVAKLFPRIFLDLHEYCAQYRSFVDEVISRFDREIQFYLSYLDFMDRLRSVGLSVCYPDLVENGQEIQGQDVYDLMLAKKLIESNGTIVCNDFHLSGRERLIVVSGPNQGGKTTFARTFGQIHFLASLGLPVPGRSASLLMYDRLFTHFERSEDIRNLRGKLQDELVRVHQILATSTARSVIIMNEIFNSTTLNDAVFLSREILSQILTLGSLCVCVSFIDELSTMSEKAISMVSVVDPSDPTRRTFKVVKKPADGLAYALSLAEKYRLSYNLLTERLKK